MIEQVFNEYGYLMDEEHGEDIELLCDILNEYGVDIMRLQEIYKNLIDGKTYGFQRENVKYPYFEKVLFFLNGYVYFANGGSGAVSCTINNIDLVLDSIFKCNPEKFLEKYECK